MCKIGKHICNCTKEYECILPDWACPTIGGDEDGNLCDECCDRIEEGIANDIYDEELRREQWREEQARWEDEEWERLYGK